MKNLKHKIISSLGTDKFDDIMDELDSESNKEKKRIDSLIKELAEDESWNGEQKKEIKKYLKTR